MGIKNLCGISGTQRLTANSFSEICREWNYSIDGVGYALNFKREIEYSRVDLVWDNDTLLCRDFGSSNCLRNKRNKALVMTTVLVETYAFRDLSRMWGFNETIREYMEMTANPSVGVPMPQFDRYEKLERKGKIKCIGACDKETGELVGVAVVAFNPSQHYGEPIAGVESLYLRHQWRCGTNGKKLLNKAKEVAKTRGAKGLVFMAPPNTRYERFCERLGMINTHKAYWWSV